ncbi:HWE histidine kinase domain-containing protein [Caulobacter segnis]
MAQKGNHADYEQRTCPDRHGPTHPHVRLERHVAGRAGRLAPKSKHSRRHHAGLRLSRGAVDRRRGDALYNDAYSGLLGHRDDLGHAGLGVLESAHAVLAPALASARRGETVTFEDHPLPLRRDGAPEDGCFTLSCSPVRDETGAVAAVFLILIETTERVRAGQARSLMVAELQHRVRNILAVIRSIVSRTVETSETVDDLSAHLDGRLSAYGEDPGAVDPRSQRRPAERLVRDELLAQVADEDRIAIEGPEILLPLKAAEVMTLAVHELAANATKYGGPVERAGSHRHQLEDHVARRVPIGCRSNGAKAGSRSPPPRHGGEVSAASS